MLLCSWQTPSSRRADNARNACCRLLTHISKTRSAVSHQAATAAASALQHENRPSATNLYEVLRVPNTATAADIKTAFRRLASVHHPDVSPGSEDARQQFLVINLAYEVLSDPQLRCQYDRHGFSTLGTRFAFLQQFVGPEDGSRPPSASGAALGRQQYVRRGTRQHMRRRGRDIYTVAGLSFKEACTGTERVVAVSAIGRCPDCEGAGHAGDPAALPACRLCKGLGQVVCTHWVDNAAAAARSLPQTYYQQQQQQTHMQQQGHSQSQHVSAPANAAHVVRLATCPACAGDGLAAQPVCSRCSGCGQAWVQRSVRVYVPAGVVDSQVLRVPGQGDVGAWGGPPGDMFVRLQVHAQLDDARVERRGHNLHSDLVVPLTDALLGATLPVPTVRGERLVVVPPGTQHGTLLRLENAGVPCAKAGGRVRYGQHYFKVIVQVPSLAELAAAFVAADEEQQLDCAGAGHVPRTSAVAGQGAADALLLGHSKHSVHFIQGLRAVAAKQQRAAPIV